MPQPGVATKTKTLPLTSAQSPIHFEHKPMDSSILEKLKKPFAAEEHKDRDLPGGGRWFFIPWQRIRKRVNEVDPSWSVAYTDPIVAGDYVCIRCQLTICGITREGMGNDKAYPDKKTYGTPIERAIADSFKNAAEQFGVGAYLDSQDFVVKHLRSQGDNRGYAYSDKRTEDRAKQGRSPQRFPKVS
jgi:hypothetical protein